MRKLIIIFIILCWLASGYTGLTYHWLYCTDYKLDLTLDDVPILLFTGSVLGPFAWGMVAWHKVVPDDLIIIKNPRKHKDWRM